MNILKAIDEKGEVLIPVYGADRPGVDVQGDVISADDLFLGMCHWAAGKRSLRLQHTGDDLPPDVVRPLACFMTGDKPFRGDGYTAPAKTWCLWLKVNLQDERGKEVWRNIKDGKLGGLSIGGAASAAAYLQGESE